MTNRFWLRTAWGGLTALGLAGCASGVGRTALRDEPPARATIPACGETPVPGDLGSTGDLVNAASAIRGPTVPGSPAAVANVPAAPSALLAVDTIPPALTPAASTTTPTTTAPPVPAPQSVIQLVDHERPLPFPEFLAHAGLSEQDAPSLLIQTAGNETIAANTTSSDAAPALAPAPMEPAAPLLPPDNLCAYPLDFGTALALVSGQNPEVGFARWRVEEAYARLEQADVLWLPTIQAGLNFDRHDGNLQGIRGEIIDVNRSSLNAGFGTGAIAAGTTTVPGLSAQFHAADAIFQPRIAERTAWARRHAADAVLQDRMLDAALAYLELLESAQNVSIAQEVVAHTAELAHVTDQYARTGQGLLSDADRLRTELALRRNEAIRADERFAVASVRLAEILSLDAGYRLLPCEVTVVPIDLVPLDHSREELLASGLTSRPELKESRCLVAEACERLRREKYAPLMPSVLLGLSYGGFGGGTGGNVAHFNDRADFDALAYWQVRNLGFGERAQRQAVGSQIEQAKFTQIRLMDRIAREIVEAQTQVRYRRQQIDVSQSAVAAALQSYDRNTARIQEGQGLPIEVLQSINAFALARREYVTAVVDYNKSQFRLQRALGWPVAR